MPRRRGVHSHRDRTGNRTSIGAVVKVGIEMWDLAYGGNVRGPVLMAQAFQPDVVARDHGCFVCISSSGAAPYIGAYLVFKTTQVELSRVLDGEMEGRKVHALSFCPGLVHTPSSIEGIGALVPLYKKSVDEIFALSNDITLATEEAGAGFARTVVLAERFPGKEISSFVALSAIGIAVGSS
jgi:NAD(P)-dependent dehydrogenase (short-subunit alcohol dehydrogenase family)